MTTTQPTPAARARHGQRGGFLVGLVVGLLIGLALSLAIALYVTKVPVPFVNKVPQRSSDQDATQAEKNRNWDPNAPLSGKPATRPASASGPASTTAPTPPSAQPSTRVAAPAPAANPPTQARPASSAPTGSEAFTYFVQAGAFARSEDAEQQRASLAMMGLTARVTEREQAGRMVFRVRLGPFERKEEADATKEKLAAAGVESALVRVQR